GAIALARRAGTRAGDRRSERGVAATAGTRPAPGGVMDRLAMPLAVVLRDIHVPPAPSWWSPAPGWWLLAAVLLVVAAVLLLLRWRRRRRHRAVLAMFEQHLQAATTPAEQLAAMSELLRRAARRRDPQADRLEGEAWLQWLDGPRG